MPTHRENFFVIMPFSKTSGEHTEKYWTEHFESFLKPLIEENPNLKAHRSEALRGDILRQIITDIVTSRVVVVDLTDHNPNVYWELGVRQSFKHGTVTIAEAGTELPFDISAKGTLFYHPKDHIKMGNFRKRFRRAIKDCLANPDRPDSHVLETLTGRGTLFEIFRRDEALRRLDAVITECNTNLDVLDSSIKTARENQKTPDRRQFPTSRFRYAAIELLITNRYIDEDSSFFDLAEQYTNDIIKLDAQLNMWEHSAGSTEKWLLKYDEIRAKRIEEFKDKIETARKKISK